MVSDNLLKYQSMWSFSETTHHTSWKMNISITSSTRLLSSVPSENNDPFWLVSACYYYGEPMIAKYFRKRKTNQRVQYLTTCDGVRTMPWCSVAKTTTRQWRNAPYRDLFTGQFIPGYIRSAEWGASFRGGSQPSFAVGWRRDRSVAMAVDWKWVLSHTK